MSKSSQTHVGERWQLVVRGKDGVHGVIFPTVGGVTWCVRGSGLPRGWTLAAV